VSETRQRTVIVTFRLRPDERDWLRELATLHQATVGTFVRDVLADMVAEYVECRSLTSTDNGQHLT